MIATLQLKIGDYFNRKIAQTPKIKLQHNRIFLWPTKACLFFGITTFIILLMAINYQNSMAYAVSFWLFALLFVGLFQAHFNFEHLELTNVGFTPVFAGQECSFKVRIEAHQRDYYALELEFREHFFNWRAPKNSVPLVNVKKKHVKEIELLYKAHQRGYLIAPKIKVSTRFPLGLFTVWSWVNLDFKAVVYPQPVPGEIRLNVSDEDNQHSNNTNTQSGVDDFLGFKAYQAGDVKARLDWKAYSRGMGLQVKQFGTENNNAKPCLDFALIDGDVETRLSIMCWHVLELTKQNQGFSLQLPNQHISLNVGLNHQKKCLNALALYGVKEI